jgi:hypothetical protein
MDLETGKKKKLTTHLNKAKQITYKLLKNALPVAAKIATAGLLDLSDFSETALSDLSEKVIKERFDAYEEAKNSLIEFRENLRKVTEEILDN